MRAINGQFDIWKFLAGLGIFLLGMYFVEQALKMAFQYWKNLGVTGRDTYLAFGDAYHGDTIGAMSVVLAGVTIGRWAMVGAGHPPRLRVGLNIFLLNSRFLVISTRL